jgi:hypothetical protein
MGEPEPKNERPKEERRFSQEQYEMLKRCSDKKDMTKWNEWRKDYPDEEIWLQGRNFKGWWLQEANFMHGSILKDNTYTSFGEVHLEGANFEWANLQSANFAGAHIEGKDTCFWSVKARDAQYVGTHLEDADLSVAHLNNCNFSGAFLENAKFVSSHISGANFACADIRGCSARGAIVDGETDLAYCQVNRYSSQRRFTDFNIVALSSVRIDTGTKQLLEYNIRRKNWEDWYKEHPKLKYIVRPFWLMSDYGLSTGRIVAIFLGVALVFANIYYHWGRIAPPGIVDNLFVGRNGVVVPWWLVPLRAFYFAIITMTLGFSDMYANAQSIFGHILITVQALLGYVLLGALVTRFAVLFTAGGPAGKFSNDK